MSFEIVAWLKEKVAEFESNKEVQKLEVEAEDLIDIGYKTVVADILPEARSALIAIVTGVAVTVTGGTFSIPAIVAAAAPLAETQGIKIGMDAFHDITRLIVNGLQATVAPIAAPTV